MVKMEHQGISIGSFAGASESSRLLKKQASDETNEPVYEKHNN
jgi:hypothetical protein